MADKKKGKQFPQNKECAPPRHPVILKSERETSKEPPAKEKVESQKPPTILLKPREPSTPKDRPNSPKNVVTDSEIQPSKIAQNENKEKKILEQKVHPIISMKEPVKLLDENLEFNNSALEFLHDSSTNYLVVGIMGTQGVGKSMILNLIAHDKSMDEICNHILTSHEIPSDPNMEENDTSVVDQRDSPNFVEERKKIKEIAAPYFKFKMQDIEQIERGVHCTKGVDMYVTDDRVILLDCQALWSPSLLEDISGMVNPVAVRTVNMVSVDCLQIASYLMAICHVLVAVQDWFTDYNFLRYIQTAEMLKPSLSASHAPAAQDSSESTQTGENSPHLVLLHNRCKLEDYTPDNVKQIQDLYRKVFQKSNLQLNSGLYLYNDTNKNGISIDNVCKSYSVDTCGLPINLFLLPEIQEDFDNKEIYRGHPSFEKLAMRLRWMTLGVHRHQITNVANLSEKGWFHYCSKAWDTIRKCTFFMEYERFLP